MHVPLSYAQLAVPGQFLHSPYGSAARRQVRAERVSKQMPAPRNVRPSRRPLHAVLDLLADHRGAVVLTNHSNASKVPVFLERRCQSRRQGDVTQPAALR